MAKAVEKRLDAGFWMLDARYWISQMREFLYLFLFLI